MTLPTGTCSCSLTPDSMCFNSPDRMYRCCNCDNRIRRPYPGPNIIDDVEIFTFTDGVSEPVRCTRCRGVAVYDSGAQEFYCPLNRHGCGAKASAGAMLSEYERLDRHRCRVGGAAQKGMMSSGVQTGRMSSAYSNASVTEGPPARQIPSNVVKCECGNDAADAGGIHSPWCPKAKGNA